MIERGVRARTIIEITEDNLPYVKELMKMVGDKGSFRHLDNVTGNFSISDRKIYQAQIMGDLSTPSEYTGITNDINHDVTTFRVQETAEPQSIKSTVKAFVAQQQCIFEIMWNKAIPAKQRIKEIAEGLKREFTEKIQDQTEIQSIIYKMLSFATSELDIVFPTRGSFIKFENEGFFKLLDDILSNNNELQIKILSGCESSFINNFENNIKNHLNITFEFIDKKTQSMVIIADKESVIAIELNNDKNEPEDNEHYEMGLAIYSNSKNTLLTYDLIFETLWTQAELRNKS